MADYWISQQENKEDCETLAKFDTLEDNLQISPTKKLDLTVIFLVSSALHLEEEEKKEESQT